MEEVIAFALSAFVSLFIIINPFSTASVFHALTKGKSPKEAGRIAAACSALCIQKVGARSGPKSRMELVKFLKKAKT